MALFDTNSGLGNLFSGMNIFGAKLPDYLTGVPAQGETPAVPGLLNQAQQDRLRNQSLLSGIIGAGATYLAQPKNQNIGLGAILGKSYLGGMQQAQGTYNAATESEMNKLKIAKELRDAELDRLKVVPNDVREYEYAKTQGFTGSFQDWATKMANLKAPKNVITIPSQEKAESKTVGEFFGKTYADIQSAGLSATNKINKVERLNTLLDGVQTGKLTPFGVDVASTAASLGFKIDPKLGNKQAADALSKEMALELRNPSGGAGMPGALSNSDREFLMSMTPGLTSDPESRKLISESMVKLAKRDQEVAKIAREYRKKNGNLDEGFYDELAKFSETNPLFTKTNKTIEVKY
jgi:hypothetical protein